MIHISNKTALILAAFTAVSAPLMMAGCGQEAPKGDTLTDENGRKYQLVKNEDGTETAKYENGDEVTFRRDENDNLNYVSGMSSLLPMMMMSYFLFHGMGGYRGTYDRATGNVLNNNKPAYTQTQQTGNAANTANANKSTVQQGSTSTNKPTVTAPAGGKTGFGSAGEKWRCVLMEKTYMDELDRNIFPYVEYPGYPYRYPTHLPLVIERKQAEKLREVSGALFRIFAKAAKRFQECGDEFFEEMEIPEKMRQYLRLGNVMKDLPTWLSRFDYVVDAKTGRLQMVEINADTPCAEIEAYYANGVAAKYFFKEDPNAYEWDKLRSWMKDIFIRSVGNKSRAELLQHPVLFSCFDDYTEDLGTTNFLMNAMKDAVDPSLRDTIVFESFYNLAVMEDGSLALPDGRTVSFLYRMHPMEILIEETADQDGSSLGELLMEGYKAGKFKMMNPPESLIMQSKGFQALIYALMERSPSFFSDAEKETIRNYLPESYFQRDFRLGDMPEDSEWIRKPIWGREGRGIEIINGRGERIYKKKIDEDDYVVARDSDSNLVQRCVAQQKIISKTDVGIMEGYVTLSCFMLGDTPSALYGRFSDERIAGNEAYWIPIVY